MADLASDETVEVIIRDSATSNNELKVNVDGSINVNTQAAIAARIFGAVMVRTGVGTTEVPMALLRNPSGSGKAIRIYQVLMSNLATVTSQVTFRCYVNPTITTNGTAVSSASLNVGSGFTAVGLASQSPTVSANGTNVFTTQAAGGGNTNTTELRFLGTFTLAENTSILFTTQADGTNRTPNLSLIWEEI